MRIPLTVGAEKMADAKILCFWVTRASRLGEESGYGDSHINLPIKNKSVFFKIRYGGLECTLYETYYFGVTLKFC